MCQIQRNQVQPINFRCRFEMTAADAPPSREFCGFDFLGCEAYPKAQHAVQRVGGSEAPMMSEVWHAWIASIAAPSSEFQSGRSAMEKCIHQENLALFTKRLAEPHSDAEREVLLKLLADEEAKEPPPKMGNLKQLICIKVT